MTERPLSDPAPHGLSDAFPVRTARGLIEPARLLVFFEQIAPELYRYPAAIDPASFRRAVEQTVQTLEA